jgi:hypothetical protein
MSQKVYRCGSTYSQIPCADGGLAIEAQDTRTKAQKTQADAIIRSDAVTANSMEKERLQQEAQAQRPVGKTKTTPVDQKKPPKASEPVQDKSVPVSSRLEAGKASGTKSMKKEPEYFTAQTAPEKKKAASAPK